MQEEYQNKNEWLEAVREAATGMVAGDALHFLRSWQQWTNQPIEVPFQDQYLEGLRQNLLLTAFTVASDEYVQYILQYLTTQFFSDNEYQLPALTKIEDRISAAGEGFYDEERSKISRALEGSQAFFGGVSVREWVERFERFQDVGNRDEVTNFLLAENELNGVSTREKQALKNLLEVHENYLRYPVMTVDKYVTSQQSNSLQSRRQDTTQLAEAGKLEKLTLLKAMSKYSSLAGQVITEQRLKLKNQAEPARPSITNWLKVYRDELGIGRHDSAARAKFLFESQNTQKLSNEERERVHALIRSLEDEELLGIDPERGEIIFTTTGVSNSQPARAISTTQGPAAQQSLPEDLFERFNKPGEPRKTKPASSLPTALQSVGTKHFGAVSALPEKNKEEEKAILERIRKMNTPPAKASVSPAENSKQPLGKLTFSAPQVFAGEAGRPKASENVTASVPTPAISVTPIPKPEPLPVKAVPASQSEASEQERFIPSALAAKPVPASTPSKNSNSQQNMFRIKPNRD